ncbi:hypothetical protein OG756_40215 [Streptomyces sp. NBC_01310]|uniref:hypothetical protein n=1 Tax=Streptomyces sp. NBC_01310 TaxID=2903820 RepID=UPI0035B5723F|nr:hypothetical protein OG756_40215 [Streptomyces sp. NBC_01310]
MTAHDVARALPGIEDLRDHCRGLAMLDAVLSPEWDARYYSFDAHWDECEQMASMRDGSGGEYSIVFSAAGAFVRGFDHESLMSPWARMDTPRVWPGVLDDVPDAFRPYVTEPAFGYEDGVTTVTCCLWRGADETAWRTGTITFPEEGDGDPDGANVLFELLVDRSPEAYATWASEYYEMPVDIEAVRALLAQRPMTPEIVAVLNPDVELADLAEDISEIGYPA